jgi:hypothetical protein
MIDVRNYGFEEQHQQIYDMAWRYAQERHHPAAAPHGRRGLVPRGRIPQDG